MINPTEHIKIGHRMEYAFDIVDNAPFVLTEHTVDGALIVLTNQGMVTVTADTRLQLSNGCWIRADMLRPYKHGLKHFNGVAVVMDIIDLDIDTMYFVQDTDYVNVNGFYISADM